MKKEITQVTKKEAYEIFKDTDHANQILYAGESPENSTAIYRSNYSPVPSEDFDYLTKSARNQYGMKRLKYYHIYPL